jgi:hypothetical protein
MNFYDSPLSNTDSPTNGLVNNRRIPMLRQKQDTATEL